MFNNFKSDYISWIVLIGLVLLLLEVSFFNEGLIFSLLASGAMVYFGRSLMPRMTGKILFWAGLFFFLSSVFSMMTFRFFLLAALIYIVYQYGKSKKKPEVIVPILEEPASAEAPKETVVQKQPLFENRMFGHQATPPHPYEWNDVNIQTGIGDTVIDLSLTVLPKGETVIFIRNLIGNIKVFVPYDLEVVVRHSSLLGSTEVLEHEEDKVLNQSLYIQTPGYEMAEQKVKIFTSSVVGNLEVKRI